MKSGISIFSVMQILMVYYQVEIIISRLILYSDSALRLLMGGENQL